MAKPMLKDLSLPVTDIAQNVGFNENRYMSAAFKKYCGVTPSEYRKNFFSDYDWRYSENIINDFSNKPISLEDALYMLEENAR